MEEKLKSTKKLGLWERCKTIGRSGTTISSPPKPSIGRKSKSWHGGRRSSGEDSTGRNKSVVGSFPVYVGPERRKFMIKPEHANHPLFRVLLEEAEAEYRFGSGGPIELPCHVDVFYRVLVEMESDDKRLGCGFG